MLFPPPPTFGKEEPPNPKGAIVSVMIMIALLSVIGFSMTSFRKQAEDGPAREKFEAAARERRERDTKEADAYNRHVMRRNSGYKDASGSGSEKYAYKVCDATDECWFTDTYEKAYGCVMIPDSSDPYTTVCGNAVISKNQ